MSSSSPSSSKCDFITITPHFSKTYGWNTIAINTKPCRIYAINYSEIQRTVRTTVAQFSNHNTQVLRAYQNLHADSLGGNVRPEKEFLAEIVVECNDTFLSVDEQVIVARVKTQFSQVVSVCKQQKRLVTCKQKIIIQQDSIHCLPEPSIRRVWPSSLLVQSACAVL